MTWIRDLLVSVFTRHLGAKLLALLLSVGLFGFVLKSLTGTQEIPNLEVEFNLAEDLKNTYVLLTPRMNFKGLTMTGMRNKVDPLARVYRSSNVKVKIDVRFISNYRPDTSEDLIRIPVDATLFHDEQLFGKDIAVGGLPNRDIALLLDRLVSRDARVAAAPGQQTTLPPTHQFEPKLALAFNVRQVKLWGPSSAFPPPSTETTVYVLLENIEKQLARTPVPGERGTAHLSGATILWKEGGIVEALVPFLHIEAHELSSEPLSAAEFQRRIEVSCEVSKRKTKIPITVPIHLKYPIPKPYDLLTDWELFWKAGTFTLDDLKAGSTQKLEVNLPAALAGDKVFLANLVLVLDVAEARLEGGRLIVPIYLDLKDRGNEGDRESLSQVEIAIQGEAVVEFRKPQ